ncbi:MAG TPA: hypothetical protein VGK19_17875 [Capsulimonadaceae bacterium]|jgi:alpha-galactosidase
MFNLSVLRQPNFVSALTDDGELTLSRTADSWGDGGVEVRVDVGEVRATVTISAPAVGVHHVRMRWDGVVTEKSRVLGDHWERGYGDLEWRGIVPERPLPWYCLICNAGRTDCYGVETGGSSMAFWQVDISGITLTLDMRNGTRGVQLGDRTLAAAVIRERAWVPDETPFAAATAFCRMLCSTPRLPSHPVYGGNDWYYAYGQNSHEGILGDTDRISMLAGGLANRPYMTIDAGWSPNGSDAGPWDVGNSRFPDMARLAAEIRAKGVRPGLWFRPLTCVPETDPSLLLRGRTVGKWPVLDPTVPAVIDRIQADVRRFTAWGYELIKYDFSTFDILGKWGMQMGASLTDGDWGFADPSVTTAEAIRSLYAAIAQAAGSAVLIGCNTIGHLGAGLFDLQRTGDDTSGKAWERTRRMGINTLAFRMPQHEAFFLCDADCVGLTTNVPWFQNQQWLYLVAGSGTPLFVSIAPDALGDDQIPALMRGFLLASLPQPVAEPLDWMETTCPSTWRIDGETIHYDWSEPGGAKPYFYF